MSEKFYDLKRDGLTQSLLASFIKCRRLAWYYVNGYKEPRTSPALIWGSALHEALGAIYSERIKKKNRVLPIPDAYRIGEAALDDYFVEALKETVSPDEYSSFMEEKDKIKALLQGYLTSWKDDLSRVLSWKMVETEFRVPVRGIELRGKVDGLFVRSKNLTLFETKSWGRLDPAALTEKLAFDFQVLFYITALEESVKKSINHALYNVVKKPEIRPLKTESWEAFLYRLRKDSIDRSSFYFHRWPLVYSDKQKASFRTELDAKLEAFEKWVNEDFNPTFKNEESCLGRYNCGYLEACSGETTAFLAQRERPFEELSK